MHGAAFVKFFLFIFFILVPGTAVILGKGTEKVPQKSPEIARDGRILRDYWSIQSTEVLPGTVLLDWKQDYSERLNAGVERFLTKETEKVRLEREKRWSHSAETLAEYEAFLAPKRERLSYILGLRDPRVPGEKNGILSPAEKAPAQPGAKFSLRPVRWQVFSDYFAEGLLAEPLDGEVRRLLIAVPHCGTAPETYFQSVPRFRNLAENEQTAVLIPAILGREPRKVKVHLSYPAREAIYLSAFELGRHIVGYEIETIRAFLDHWTADSRRSGMEIHAGGFGDGAAAVFYAGVLDPRIQSVHLAGYFDRREGLWSQPLDRNVFGLLEDFGDAELAAMIFPRKVFVASGAAPIGPVEEFTPKVTEELRAPSCEPDWVPVKFRCSASAPWKLEAPAPENVRAELERARKIPGKLAAALKESAEKGTEEQGAGDSWIQLISETEALALNTGWFVPEKGAQFTQPEGYAAQQERILTQLDHHTQTILASSWKERREFMKKLDFSSVEAYEKSAEAYRTKFYDEILGNFKRSLLPFNARTRKVFDEDEWTGFDVVLDVFEDVEAQGLLLVPKDLKPGEKRPAVVYQHGLEGRPEGGLTRKAHNQILARLAERGFIVFAPQDVYAGGDVFRRIQRKSRPLGKTLYSFTIPRHQQITEWLGTLPFVEREKIGFYGISYGGKTAMRVPAVVQNYALSIVSADFGDWVTRVASSIEPFSYVGTREYEISEFDLGGTFNHAEMAALIAPRPFMVERGHFDACGRDEHVAFEYAKVRFLYEARLHLPDRTEIEWGPGGHEIFANGTIRFLEKWLKESPENAKIGAER